MPKFLKSPAFKKIALVVITVVALCAGSWYGWQWWQHRQSPLFAYEKIREALNPPNPSALAEYVDINAISRELSRAVAENFPFFKAGSDQERNIGHALQAALLEKFLDKGEKKQAPAGELSEEELLQKDLTILPDDFLAQALGSMRLSETSPGQAIITVKIDNPLLQKNFTLAFDMDKTSGGWKITRLANARELVAQTREAMLARHARLRQIYLDKNEATYKLMNQLIPIQSCAADAAPLSNGNALALVVRVIARNRGDVQINNFNVDTRVSGARGQILNRLLNAAKPVAPGEDFDHRWQFDLDTSSDLGRALLAGGHLQCEASWHTLGLNNGRVLKILVVPNPDEPCPLPNHNHPLNFCETPVFKSR